MQFELYIFHEDSCVRKHELSFLKDVKFKLLNCLMLYVYTPSQKFDTIRSPVLRDVTKI